MPWWLKNNLRMIQNNIRDIDVTMNIDKHIEWLKSFDVNVLQIGCGGITSHFPTELAYQYRNPYLKGDFFGEVLEKCHKSDIRVIARFDFSKTHESFYDNHKDWYVRKADGTEVRYHDTVSTCVNGEYQRNLSLNIISEVLKKYPVDGIFFNMFGYVKNDYSGNTIGICQCENCKKRFKEMYGETLPTKEDINDSIFQKYLEFKKLTVNDILSNIRTVVKNISPEIAISTYTTHGIDIVRNESNSALDRPLPFWIYNSSDNVSLIENTYEDKIVSNCAINAVDLPYRFMGVSKYLNQIRLYENIASGSGLDWCIIGNFEDYPDYANFETTKEIFRFHKKYEQYYGNFNHKTKTMLISNNVKGEVNSEFRGIFKMLKEEHLPFTVVDQHAFEDKLSELDDYDYIIFPNCLTVNNTVQKALLNTSARLVATGLSFEDDTNLLRKLFGVSLTEKITEVRGTYVAAEPQKVYTSFQDTQWVFLDQEYADMKLSNDSEGFLPLVSKSMYGPPERCYGHVKTNQPMVGVKAHKNAYFPWNIATLYYQYGYEEFKHILLETLHYLKPIHRDFTTNAPDMVEVFYNQNGENQYIVQLLNLCGFNGTTAFKPVLVKDIHIQLKNMFPKKIYELTKEGMVEQTLSQKIKVDELGLYKAFLIEV